MVDVQDPVGERRDEVVPDDLHVAREHYELDAFLPEQVDLAPLLVALRVGRDRELAELDVEAPGHIGKPPVVAHDERDVDAPLPRAPASEDVVQAVREVGHEERDPRHHVREEENGAELERP